MLLPTNLTLCLLTLTVGLLTPFLLLPLGLSFAKRNSYHNLQQEEVLILLVVLLTAGLLVTSLLSSPLLHGWLASS